MSFAPTPFYWPQSVMLESHILKSLQGDCRFKGSDILVKDPRGITLVRITRKIDALNGEKRDGCFWDLAKSMYDLADKMLEAIEMSAAWEKAKAFDKFFLFEAVYDLVANWVDEFLSA